MVNHCGGWEVLDHFISMKHLAALFSAGRAQEVEYLQLLPILKKKKSKTFKDT